MTRGRTEAVETVWRVAMRVKFLSGLSTPPPMSNRIKESAPEIARPKHREDVQSRLVDGEIVILDYDGGFIHQLNGTATFIWEKCDGQLTAVEIASQVCQAFEIDETTALKDVLDTLRDLQKLSLVTDC